MNSTIDAIIEELDLGDFLTSRTITGGSINEVFLIESTEGKYFLKLNNAGRFPNMFETEKRGLELLSQSPFKVPLPLKVGICNNSQYILMNFIEPGAPGLGFWQQFGRDLAGLHLLSSKQFGLDHDNYIGSLSQSNEELDTWAEFYRTERLLPQIKLAQKSGKLTAKMKIGFDELLKRIDEVYPTEPPSLLHGDLWSGNMMITTTGEPCLFDPAVYYGHREMDLAMMALFGGFGEEWVQSYNEIYPLEHGWRERIPLGQLYPLMVHVNLFGSGYSSQVEAILQKFT